MKQKTDALLVDTLISISDVSVSIVCYTAVISVVTQRSSPLTLVGRSVA